MEKKTLIFLLIIAAIVVIFLYPKNNSTEPIVEKEQKPITLLLVGDIMLDRGVRNALNREGGNYAFEGVRDLLTSADLTVGNLEGTFTDKPSVSVVDNKILRFTFDLSLATML